MQVAQVVQPLQDLRGAVGMHCTAEQVLKHLGGEGGTQCSVVNKLPHLRITHMRGQG